MIPNTSDNSDDLIAELYALDQRYHYLDMLRAIRVAVDHTGAEKIRKAGYYILILNYETKKLRLQFFNPGKVDEAMDVYNKIESTRAETKIDAVLVSVSSFDALRVAYPNYFTDIGDFVEKVEDYLSNIKGVSRSS